MTQLETAFWKFHAEHPEVYEQVCEYAKRALANGFTHYSIARIIEGIRLEQDMKGGKPLRIANAHRAYYARFWMHQHPQYKGFFTIAALPSKNNELRMEYA